MAKISYYFAVSLDGYIARLDHSVDWLDPYFGEFNTPYDFKAYMKTVSTIIMGRKTLEKALVLGPLPLQGKRAFVYTGNSNYSAKTDEVTIIHADILGHIQNLRKMQKERIWLLGGGVLAAFLLAKGLLDELVVNVIPVMIGKGIPWIAEFTQDHAWNLSEQYTSQNGIVQLVYHITALSNCMRYYIHNV